MKEFYHYNDGVKIDDYRINRWLEEARSHLLEGQGKTTMSSGDTSVIGLEWPTEFEFFVCNSSGRSKIRFNKRDELEEMKNFKFNYKRPLDKQQ